MAPALTVAVVVVPVVVEATAEVVVEPAVVLVVLEAACEQLARMRQANGKARVLIHLFIRVPPKACSPYEILMIKFFFLLEKRKKSLKALS